MWTQNLALVWYSCTLLGGETSRDGELIWSHYCWMHPILPQPQVSLLSSPGGVHVLPQEVSLAPYTGENPDRRKTLFAHGLMNWTTLPRVRWAGLVQQRQWEWESGATQLSWSLNFSEKVSLIFFSTKVNERTRTSSMCYESYWTVLFLPQESSSLLG